MGKTCWVFVKKRKKRKKKLDFTSTKMLWHYCALEYVLEMWESTSPMSEMLMFFYEKTPNFDEVVNF